MDLGGCELEPLRREFHGPAGTVRLSKAEYALLAYLAARPRVAIAKEELLREVWGYSSKVQSRTVDTTVNRLRNKLELAPKTPVLIVTERGRGVRFDPPAPSPSIDSSPIHGRRADLLRILAALDERDRGLLSLVGPPGVGKTTLARRIARDRRSPLVEVRDARTAEDLRALVLRTLGRPAAQGPFHAVDLLLLDNLEQLEPGAERCVAEWAALGSVVATSQRAMGVADEHILRIAPLAPDAALALLRARLPDPDLVDGAALERLIASCDRLPLELELLGTAIPTFGADSFAEVSALNVRAPTGGWDLAQAMAWAWSLLDDDLARALRWLSVFHADFDLQSAATVLDVPPFELLGTLSELHNRSLVAGEAGVFRLLGVVRDSARQRLMSAGEQDEANRGLMRWCTGLWDDYVRRGPTRVQRHHLDVLACLDRVHSDDVGALVAVLVEATPVPTWMELDRIRSRAEHANGPLAAFLWAAYRDASQMAGDAGAARDAQARLTALDLHDSTSLSWTLALSTTAPDATSSAVAAAYEAAPDYERGYFVQRLEPVATRTQKLKALSQTAKARGWSYAGSSVDALLGLAAFEAGELDRAVKILRNERGGHLASFRRFYLGMARLEQGAVADARAHFAAGRSLEPQAYAARCAALVLVVDLAAGRDVRTALRSEPLIDRFNVGRLAGLLRTLVGEAADPRWEQTLTDWRAGRAPIADRGSFVAYAAGWLLSRVSPSISPSSSRGVP